jgi:hypothetical protein
MDFFQSLNVVETQELRDLLLYLNADLKDGDIPHRTKLTRITFESYHREWKKLVEELQVWLSLRVSSFSYSNNVYPTEFRRSHCNDK